MKHSRRMAAPIIVAAVVVIYYLAIAAYLLTAPGIPIGLAILITAVSLILSGVMIGVLVSRIKEIRSGEEDDLGKY